MRAQASHAIREPGEIRQHVDSRPQMIDLTKRASVLYDGDCGICTWFADFTMRVDVERRFYVEPYQQIPEQHLQDFGISYADCAKRLQVISTRGKVYGGAFAVNYFFLHYFPWSLLVGLIYLLPVLLVLEVVIYALVAKNRGRLSRRLGMKACLARDNPKSKV